MKYTVLLLRPDYVADDYGQDTYQAWVEAESVTEAIRKAQLEVVIVDDPDDRFNFAADYFVLAVYLGHQADIQGTP